MEWFVRLSLVRQHDPTATAQKLVKLEFNSEESFEMPIVWILAHTLLYLWGVRANGKTVSLIITRATMESKISILRETRFRNEHSLIKEMFESIL